MISGINVKNFKSFTDVTLSVGSFTVIVGANASGKSNIRDAFRFIHGIGRGYTLAEIIGGKYGAGGQSEWAQMRGAASEVVQFGSKSFSVAISMKDEWQNVGYFIEVEKSSSSRGGFRVTREHLDVGYERVFDSHPGPDDPVSQQDDEAHLLLRLSKTGTQRRLGARVAVRNDQPALTQVPDFKQATRSHRDRIQTVLDTLGAIRFLDLVPDAMRRPAFPGQNILGDGGENLPTVLQEICSDKTKKATLIEWMRELTPMDVADFEFPADPTTGLVQLQIHEFNGNTISSYSTSDGTLRFLAMLAALLGSNPAKLYFFEEIDNGIHPTRLRLLLDLIERQTSKSSVQVVTTTHSPDLLSMIADRTFDNTSVVYRQQGTNHSSIAPLSSLPDARRLRENQGLGKLHSSGWIEDALFFMGGQGQ